MIDPCPPLLVHHTAATLRSWGVWLTAHPGWQPVVVGVAAACGGAATLLGGLPLKPAAVAPAYAYPVVEGAPAAPVSRGADQYGEGAYGVLPSGFGVALSAGLDVLQSGGLPLSGDHALPVAFGPGGVTPISPPIALPELPGLPSPPGTGTAPVPIPEPRTAFLLLGALAMILACRWAFTLGTKPP